MKAHQNLKSDKFRIIKKVYHSEVSFFIVVHLEVYISRQYEDDAVFFCSVATDLGASSEEMSASMININESIDLIANLVGEITKG